ncbi:MAG: formylglycine-generating enzyme family protein [Rhodospirillaceae bacterium]|nr:formylglycine-generating enzyme family protein [Rhodospirillaceae bacterium]
MTAIGQTFQALFAVLVVVVSGQTIAAEAPGTVLRDCATCPEVVVVPPGTFTMGSNAINEMRGGVQRPEGPERQVTIARSFAAGKYEVTNAEFAAFVDATGYSPSSRCSVGMNQEVIASITFRGPLFGREPDAKAPAVCVSWLDAKAYAAWLSKLTGKTYRLLTEAEWEYAAKAGSTTKFPWGEDERQACEHENTFDLDVQNGLPQGSKLTWEPAPCHDGHAMISPVGSYPPNKFGLHDMLGNVWEWTEDCSFEKYPAAPIDGSAVQVAGTCDFRAVRGGSWYTRQERHRPTFRGRDPETKSGHHFGFRIARDVE